MSKPHLSGSKTLIFGATGGIGRAIAVDLAHHGKAVHLAGRDADALKALADEISAPYTVFDALDTGSINTVIAEASSDEPIVGLVWAVGSILLKPLSHLSDEDFLTTYHLNVVAPAMAVKAASGSLKSANGSVLLFSSVAATQGFSAHAAIGPAKAAVEGLTRSLAAELAPDVRVNAIAPSLSETKMAEFLTSNAVLAKGIAAAHALPRLGQPSDFVALSRLLLDNETGGWISGAIMPVDGGRGTLRTKG